MTQQTINIGSNANDGTGDDLRTAMQKVNDNFSELYGASPLTSIISIEGNQISTTASDANLKLTASGTGTIEFEGIQIRDNHIEATRSNDDLILSASGTGDVVVGAVRIHGTTLSSDDSTKITINEAVDITGNLRAPIIDTNILSSSDSSAIQIIESVNVSGNLFVNGSITSNGAGLVTLGSSAMNDGTATTSTSSQTSIDTTAIAAYRSVRYDVSVVDTTNSRYALYNILITHNNSTAYVSSNLVSSTGSDLGDFDADISGGNLRLLVTPATSDTINYTFIKTAISV